MQREMIRRWARIAFWCALTGAYVLAILPQERQIGTPSDKVNHIIAFLTLSLLARLGWSRARAISIAAGLVGFGALIELSQALPAIGRDASLADLAADAAATLAGLILGSALLWLTRRRRPA